MGVLYRPSEKKLKNSVTKDYMGKAVRPVAVPVTLCSHPSLQKLIAASDPGDVFTEFTGSTRLKQGISPSGVFLDRPDIGSDLSRSATAPAASVPSKLPP